VQKYGTARQAADDSFIGVMLFVYWINKVTEYSNMIILIC